MATTTWRPLAAARALARRDPGFARLLARVGPVAIPQWPSTFATLAARIVHQQLSGRAAAAIWRRVVARFDDGAVTPEAVLRKRPGTLRAAGLSAAKTASLRDLARHVACGGLVPETLAVLPDEEVTARLTRVRGIGPWSAHMHLIFSLARPDVWPTGDLGVRKGLARFRGLATTPGLRDAEALGEPFRPWRSILAWCLWRIHGVEAWEAEAGGAPP